MESTVKAHPANVGKRVRATFKRGPHSYERVGVILRFRGGYANQYNQPHSAFVRFDMPNGNFRDMGISLNQLRYV